MRKGICLGCLPKELTLEQKFEVAKEAGFDGIEVPSVETDEEVEQFRELATLYGLEIPSMMGSVHWKWPLSDPDPGVRLKCADHMRRALRHGPMLGANTLLLVPAVVKEEVTYEEAMQRSKAEIAGLVPVAETYGVVIAVENVWNKFLLSPIEFCDYVDSFHSDFLKAYFDVGNIMLYGYPHHWIRSLGASRLAKVHLKDFQVGPKRFVNLLEGDVPWREVVKALREIGYEDYLTVEVGMESVDMVKETARRVEQILEMG